MIIRRARKPPAPVTLRRIVIEAAGLFGLHIIAAQALARTDLLEHLLSPGGESRFALGVTAFFMLLRTFTLVLAPGWVAARLWLLWTRKSDQSVRSRA